MLPAESNNLPSLPLIVSVSVRSNALKVIIFVSLVYYYIQFILMYYKMNPRFIKDVAKSRETGFISLQCYAYEDYHVYGYPLYGYLLQGSGYYVYERV